MQFRSHQYMHLSLALLVYMHKVKIYIFLFFKHLCTQFVSMYTNRKNSRIRIPAFVFLFYRNCIYLCSITTVTVVLFELNIFKFYFFKFLMVGVKSQLRDINKTYKIFYSWIFMCKILCYLDIWYILKLLFKKTQKNSEFFKKMFYS